MARSVGPDPIAKALVELSLELHRRRLWLEVEADSPVLVRLEGFPDPFAVLVTGHLGEEYGLFIFRGPRAFADARRVIEDLAGPDSIDPADIADINIEALGAIDPRFRGFLQDAGFRGLRERLAPAVIIKPAHREARGPHRSEVKALAMIVRAFLAAHDAGELPEKPCDGRRERVLELTVTGTWRAVEIGARFMPWPSAAAGVVELAFPADLRAQPRLDETWLVDFPILPGSLDGGGTFRALLVVEEVTGELLALDAIPGSDPEPARLALIRLFVGEDARRSPGLPAAVHFASPLLHRALGPGLESLGIATAPMHDTSALDRVFEPLLESLGFPSAGSSAPEREPESLEEWKAADQGFVGLLREEIERQGLTTSRALARYFGSEPEAVLVLDQLESLSPVQAFHTWLATDYRPTRRSKTHLEKMLARGGLSPAQRALAEARLAAVVSMFRVDSVEAGLSLEVEDLLTGRPYTVHDRALSGSDVLGRVLTLRLVKVADWHFPCFAGPPLPLFQVHHAFRYLQHHGMELSSAGVRASSHLLGHLWRDLLPDRRQRPVLQNTDGDPLLLITATYRVTDAKRVARALDGYPDVFCDEPGSAWTWSRPSAPRSDLDERTTLARLELMGEDLLVEVNSKRRLAAVREWLDRIPGVAFASVTEEEPLRPDRPLDDRLRDRRPAQPPPEVVAEMRRVHHAKCMQWLDEPVPILGDRTPRSACRTAAGKAEVARLIRSMPDVRFPGGTSPVPRAEMLRDLGIEVAR